MKTVNVTIITTIAAILLLLTSCGSGGGSTAGEKTDPEQVGVVTASKIADDLFQAQSLFSGSTYMYVKLNRDPGQAIILTVEYLDGDPDQLIYPFASENGGGHVGVQTYVLNFNSSNWQSYQKIYFYSGDDSDEAMSGASYRISTDDIEDFNSKSVQSVPAVAATKSVTGTITRGPFALALVAFDETVDDVLFSLSWMKIGTGTDARYYGSYTDNDPLNQLIADGVSPEGNEDRNDYVYPAYGFWKDDSLHFVIVKNIVTPRSTAEINLILLTAADEDFSTGIGYVTASGSSTSAVGSYDISFIASDNGENDVVNIFPIVVDDPDFPIFDIDLQTQTYTPGAVSAANGNWELSAEVGSEYLFSGTATNEEDDPVGVIHGFAYASIDGQSKPNVIGVLEDGGNSYIFGLPFYSEPDADFPFGSLGGRFVNMADGTNDRLFLFLSLTGTN